MQELHFLCVKCHIWLIKLCDKAVIFFLLQQRFEFSPRISYLIHLVNMRFYDLRRRLCEEREVTSLAGLHCPGPGADSVQCTGFTKTVDQQTHSLKLDVSKKSRTSPAKTTSAPSSPQSPASVNIDFSSDSDSGNRIQS